jgi:hypothetical protein
MARSTSQDVRARAGLAREQYSSSHSSYAEVQARRFATRYEKTLRNYAAVVAIGCALLWLRI